MRINTIPITNIFDTSILIKTILIYLQMYMFIKSLVLITFNQSQKGASQGHSDLRWSNKTDLRDQSFP